jgi:gamma-glutamylcyclotransferase (GGCT)/AIG2-like uncharacterized protein YtfP
MLYFAYGSNLNRAGMRSRCPAAVPVGRALLRDHALVFRRWADVVPAPGCSVAGALWRITPACESALDDYEDVDGGLYRRLTLPVHPEGDIEPVAALVYRMTAAPAAPPDPAYLAVILQGCRDFGLDVAAVIDASAAPSS